MATIQQTNMSIMTSSAQVLILPVNSAGTLLDPVLTRCKTLYPDNYQRYHRACRDGSLTVGSCMLHKRKREIAGLSAAHNDNQPNYIANLVVSDHPYHPARRRWLIGALTDLRQQLMPLIRYQGVRHAAVLARPFMHNHQTTASQAATVATNNSESLDWQALILPLITEHLQELPKLRVEIHIPKHL